MDCQIDLPRRFVMRPRRGRGGKRGGSVVEVGRDDKDTCVCNNTDSRIGFTSIGEVDGGAGGRAELDVDSDIVEVGLSVDNALEEGNEDRFGGASQENQVLLVW